MKTVIRDFINVTCATIACLAVFYWLESWGHPDKVPTEAELPPIEVVVVRAKTDVFVCGKCSGNLKIDLVEMVGTLPDN